MADISAAVLHGTDTMPLGTGLAIAPWAAAVLPRTITAPITAVLAEASHEFVVHVVIPPYVGIPPYAANPYITGSATHDSGTLNRSRQAA